MTSPLAFFRLLTNPLIVSLYSQSSVTLLLIALLSSLLLAHSPAATSISSSCTSTTSFMSILNPCTEFG
ncbi:hypothetical protein BCV72DRAFT_329312 [Rhizopus microsporus var. microsporus]|uniref:Uncharacterized protein n=1 Tax=Rhizopus microsporus var. microsporus TaxID=86635 RepID=A0A1X0R2B5_RHIZD|nr:hypothetical protein BCV72DRAFT_329312 [Rhizopus microsporus var. microsporus]